MLGTDMRSLQLWSDGAAITFVPVYGDALFIGQHTYTYDVIELSTADLPAPPAL